MDNGHSGVYETMSGSTNDVYIEKKPEPKFPCLLDSAQPPYKSTKLKLLKKGKFLFKFWQLEVISMGGGPIRESQLSSGTDSR